MARVLIRVVCHAILRVDVVPAHVQRVRQEVERLCHSKGAQLIAFVVDLGVPKHDPQAYPALAYLRDQAADVLVVVRAPTAVPSDSLDLLESCLLPPDAAMTWATVTALRRLGLLPAATGVRSDARKRALALHAQGFPLDMIARRLNTEGFVAPTENRFGWTAVDVVDLLREAEAEERAPPDGEPGEARHSF